MDAKLNEVLQKIRANLSEDKGSRARGILGKKGPPPPVDPYTRDVRDMFFDLLDEVASGLAIHHGMKESQAFAFIAKVGDRCEDQGKLPPFPDDSMNDAEIARWLNAASYSDFRQKVFDHAAMGID